MNTQTFGLTCAKCGQADFHTNEGVEQFATVADYIADRKSKGWVVPYEGGIPRPGILCPKCACVE